MRINIVNSYVRFPGPLEQEQSWLENIYYAVRIVYIVVLIAVTLLALGGIAA